MVRLSPYWWRNAPPDQQQNITLPSHTDCLIIGAGHTGLAAARCFANNGLSVVVVDQKAPGAGASTRNGGMVGGGHRQGLQELQKLFGKSCATRMLREAHETSMAFLQDLIREENIDCEYHASGRFRGMWHEKDYEATAKSLHALQKLFPLNAEMIAAPDQHRFTASPLYRGGIVFHDHGGFDPYTFHQGLLAATKRAGARVLGYCRVMVLHRQGDSYRVETVNGTIQAEKVVLASNGYTDNLVPDIKRGIFPIPSYLLATAPLPKERIAELFPDGRMMVETRARHCYYRPSPDGTRILFGGRAALVPRSPIKSLQKLEKLLHETFPDLGKVDIDYHWHGNTGFSFDQIPHIGIHKGIGYALGYSGNGNTMAPYLGHKLALRMMHDPEGETAFAEVPLPKPWWCYPIKAEGSPWFMYAMDRLYGLLDLREKWRH